MANREISQFATMAAGAQSSTMYLPIVDTSLGHVAGANQKITLDSLFFDLGANTADGATGMSGLLAAPSAAAAGSLKWYYNDATKFWLASIDGGSYYSVQRSIAAGLTAGWLPYVDTGGILNGSANATLDGNGSLFCKFVTIQSALAGLNSVAEINDSTGTDRWEIRLGASNQLIIQDFQNSKDVITLTPGATPVVQLNGTLRWLTDNSQDIGLINSGRARTAYIGTSVIIGRSSNTTGVLTFNNSTNTNQTSFQAGAASASRTYTWPLDFGAAGSVLTDAAGDGTLSWAVPSGTIGGSIAATQVAFGSGANTIQGSANLTYDLTTLTNTGTGYKSIKCQSSNNSADFNLISATGNNAQIYLNGDNSYFYWYSSNTQKWQQYMLTGDNTLRYFDLVNSRTHLTLNANTTADTASTSINSRLIVGSSSTTGSGADLDVTVNSSTRIGQIIKLAASQSADAFEVQKSDATPIFYFNNASDVNTFSIVSGLSQGSGSAAGTMLSLKSTTTEKFGIGLFGGTGGAIFKNPGGVVGYWPDATNFRFINSLVLQFSSSGDATGGADLGFARNAAGILEINNGTAGTYRDLRARYVGIGLAPTSGVLNIGGASQSGAYVSVSTSSQAANDKLISVSMAGSITGLLYAADISMTATTGVLTRITNTENATATSNCELQLVTGGASGGDPFIHFNISGNTDWSIGARNTDSDNLTITAASDLSTSVILKVTTAGAFTVIDGSTWNVGTTTGLKLGTSGGASGQKLGFFNATPIVQPLLATGAGATVDNVITVLQNLGLCRQT